MNTNTTNTKNMNKNQFIAMLHNANTPYKTLTPEQKQELRRAYLKMYFGLALTLWANGKTLGAAWQTAMDQMKTFLKSKNQNNPATEYLRTVHAAHSARWARVIMTSKFSNTKLPQENTKLIESLRKFGAKNIRESMGKINQVMQQYAQPTQTKDMQKNTMAITNDKMQMMILMRMRQNQQGNVA